MQDRVFFPLVCFVAAAMVAAALAPAYGRLPSGSVSVGDRRYDRIVVDGVQLNRMIAPGKGRLALLGQGDARTMRVAPPGADAGASANEGPHFRLGADIETQFADHVIRVTVRARGAVDAPAREMQVKYQSAPDIHSSWRAFPLRREFADYSFDFRAPALGDTREVDYLGIRPVGFEGALEIERVVFERLERWNFPRR
ncbi:MAG: hypothetical protein AAFX03_02555 [Pseudomonadota bacterium]